MGGKYFSSILLTCWLTGWLLESFFFSPLNHIHFFFSFKLTFFLLHHIVNVWLKTIVNSSRTIRSLNKRTGYTCRSLNTKQFLICNWFFWMACDTNAYLRHFSIYCFAIYEMILSVPHLNDTTHWTKPNRTNPNSEQIININNE